MYFIMIILSLFTLNMLHDITKCFLFIQDLLFCPDFTVNATKRVGPVSKKFGNSLCLVNMILRDEDEDEKYLFSSGKS